ncbi:hypothetical protein HID58_041534, partial [Brassica napus]
MMVESICNKKDVDSTLCFEVLKPNPTIAKLDFTGLANFLINYTSRNISDVLKEIKLYESNTTDLQTIKLCEELYDLSLFSDDHALKALAAKNYDSVNFKVGGTLENIVTCNEELSTMKPVPQSLIAKNNVIKNLSGIVLTILECFIRKDQKILDGNTEVAPVATRVHVNGLKEGLRGLFPLPLIVVTSSWRQEKKTRKMHISFCETPSNVSVNDSELESDVSVCDEFDMMNATTPIYSKGKYNEIIREVFSYLKNGSCGAWVWLSPLHSGQRVGYDQRQIFSMMVTEGETESICNIKDVDSTLCFEVLKPNPKLDFTGLANFLTNYTQHDGLANDQIMQRDYESSLYRDNLALKALAAKDYDTVNINAGAASDNMISCNEELSTLKPVPQSLITKNTTNSATLASVSPPLSPSPSVETSGTLVSLPVLNAQAAPLVYKCDSQAPVEASDIQAPHHVPAPPLIATQAPLSQFVPSLGSWAKPLIFKPSVTPPDPSTPRGYDPNLVGNQLAALWPTLNDEILNKQHKSKHPTRSLQIPIEKMPLPELKADGTLRFPWAARLGLKSRNLYRAASPTYQLDDVSTESQVAPAASPSLITSTAILADVLSAHAATTTPIMESVPSNNIIKEVQKTSVVDPVTTTPNANSFESEVESICNKKDVDSTLCFEVLKPNPTIAKLDFTGLANFLINYTSRNISDVLKEIKLYESNTTDLQTIKLCEELYDLSLFSDDHALKALAAKNYDSVNFKVGGTLENIVTCNEELSTMKPVPQSLIAKNN